MEFNQDCIKQYLDEDPNVAIVVVDSKCRLVYANETYLKVMDFKREEIIGQHIEMIMPMTRTLRVLRSGKPEKAYCRPLNGYNSITTSNPIVKDGQIIGVIECSLFLDMDDAHIISEMANGLDNDNCSFNKREQKYEQKMNTFNRIIGQNTCIKKVKNMAMAMAGNDSTILITGETGTGKDLFAKAIHLSSNRKQRPFVRVNCAAIPVQLMESEMFGYEEGTFTGAVKGGKKGKFELANQGTIFLDEIGEMPLSMQAKLLTVLQEKEIEPLGSQLYRSKKVDIRVIAATNQKLGDMVAKGNFRQDLYYRLNVINIEIPPLRNRKSDIPMLADSIIEKICRRMEMGILNITPEAIQAFQDYDWPGNVRELENIIERSIIRARLQGKAYIQAEHIGELLQKNLSRPLELEKACENMDLKNYLQIHEKLMLENVLYRSNGDKQRASKMLNIHLSALYKKMNKYGLGQKAYK